MAFSDLQDKGIYFITLLVLVGDHIFTIKNGKNIDGYILDEKNKI